MTTSSLRLSKQNLLGELVKRAAHKTPDKEAFIFGDARMTYQQLDDRASHVAGWLQSQGINHDDKVGFVLKNGLPFVEIFFGVALSGGVGVPINFRLAADEMAYIIHHSDSKIVFIDYDYVEMIQSIRERIPQVEKVVVIGGHRSSDMITYDSIFESKPVYVPCEQLSDEDAAMIVYTSGTTGKPKGAVLTHKNLYQNGLNMIWEFSMDTRFKQLIVAPMFHVAALSTLVNSSLVNGTSVIHRDFDPVAILETIDRERINAIFLVPAMWNFLLQVPNLQDYDLTSMEKCMTGASICPLELKKKIMNHFKNGKIYDIFGQTEMSPCTTCLHPEDSLRKTTSVGKPIINVEVRVVDDEMNDVPVGEVGEIVYRGPNLMKEYYKNPEATKEAFEGGWFHSGDLVRVDEEGFIYVVDRKKDMIISGGENIYPAEVEEVLYSHSDILETAVIGVPDQVWGERVKAFVVVKPGKSLSENDVISYCAGKLASYKKPKEVAFIDALPRNAAGKVLKRKLREFVSEDRSTG